MPRRLSFARLNPQQQPLVYLASAFICGLLAAHWSSVSIRLWFIIAVSVWLMALICWLARYDKWLMTALLLSGCVACGGVWWRVSEASVSDQTVRRLIERGELLTTEPVELRGVLTTVPELAPDRLYLSLAAEQAASLQQTRAVSGAVQLVVPFHDAEARAEYDALALDYGSRVRVLVNLMNAHGYRNPGAPDFDEMLEQRGFDASASVKSPLLIEKLGDDQIKGGLSPLYRRLYRMRARMIATMLRSFSQPTAGVLVAALFGNRHFLSRDTAEAFRDGGTFHLLVISGLHVALIAAVVMFLTVWMKSARWLRYGLVLALMWSYALMVGAQPSITRAVVMLTIALMAQLLFRAAVGANTLAAAAMALLIWQPRDLFNPSLQLSFLTVLMIALATVPLMTRLRQTGEWQPSALTPYLPRLSPTLRWLAEVLFWDEKAFRKEMAKSPIHYRLEKARLACRLSLSRAGRAAQWCLASIAATLLTTVCVQVGLLPLMIMRFHRFSIVSPLANVIESLLMFLLMIAAGAWLLIYAVSAGLALKLAGLINALGSVTVSAASPLSGWRGASVRMPDYSPATALTLYSAYFALILLLILALNWWNPLAQRATGRKEKRRTTARRLAYLALAVLLALATLLVWHPGAHQYEPGRLSVTFLDVGQGDAMVISFPRGAVMMFDSGGRLPLQQGDDGTDDEEVFIEDRIGTGEAAVAPYLWQRGIRRLDLIAISHSDTDHSEGFTELARSFEIGAALTGMIPADDRQFEPFRQAMEKASVPLRVLRRGGGFELDGARVEALAPSVEAANAPRYSNNQSLVLRLSYGNRSFLLTGDIERQTEEQLLAAGDSLRADVLKVAHHGSRTSSTEAFVKAVAPQYAVISVAAPSPFGHPHAEVLERLQRSGARVLPTSACGAITISTDGSDLQVRTFVRCESGEQSGDKVSRSSGER
ncbi:MAG TPA: ComEC/Rec2 family competence protein [Blastocatellia bacterium]|nr:ComEC/Rec2 family competence protein [Blastocatellia bacterium]